MTTVAAPALPVQATAQRERFYVRMATACLEVAVIGFLPSYWMPMFRGISVGQTSLVAGGRIVRHREMGVAGVALATAMVLVGLGMAINSMKVREAAGAGDAARVFSSVSVTGILLVAAAVMNTRKPGELSGTPGAAGTFDFTVRATDSSPGGFQQSATSALSLVIDP
jgi:hypothetical protein